MATRATHKYSGQHPIARTLKATIALLGVVAVGYVAVVLVEHSGPLFNTASQFARESQRVSSETATQTVDSQAAGMATAAVPETAKAPRRDFDYFPDHYVNQATKIEDPIPTF